MASYYKYKSREGQDQVDWRTITKGITDEITRVKGDRNKKRKDIQDAALVTYENLANKPQGPYLWKCKSVNHVGGIPVPTQACHLRSLWLCNSRLGENSSSHLSAPSVIVAFTSS